MLLALYIKHTSLNSFQPSAAFHIEMSHLICSANHMTGFYTKCKIELKMLNLFRANIPISINAFQYSAAFAIDAGMH